MAQNFQNRFRNPFLNQRETPSGNTPNVRRGGIHFTQPHELIMMKQEAARQAQAQEAQFGSPNQVPVPNEANQSVQSRNTIPPQRQPQPMPMQTGANMPMRQNQNQQQNQNRQKNPGTYHDPSVSFEPIDDATMKMIQAVTGKSADMVLPKTENPMPVKTPVKQLDTAAPDQRPGVSQNNQRHPANQPSQIIVDPSKVKLFHGFSQNEMNASIFYQKLSESGGERASIFTKMSRRNRENAGHYVELAKNYGGGDFTPETREIVAPSQLQTAVKLALREEINSLESLNDLFSEMSADNKTAALLQRFIFRKIEDVSRLNMMCSDLR